MSTPTLPNPYFRITFDVVNKTITFLDLVQIGYNSYADFKGIVRITNPNGTIIYQGAGYDLTAPTWDSPDTNGTTPTWTFAAVDLDTTSDGLIVQGEYTIDYLATLTNGSTFVHVTKTFNFDYISPVVSIDLSDNCRTSQLFSNDITDYTVKCSGTEFEPISFSRAHTIEKPLGSSANAPGTVPTTDITDTERTIGGGVTDATRLWTRVWQTEIATTLQYNVATWGIYTWVVINDVVTGSDNIDVRCDNEYCCLRLCVENAIALMNSSLSGSLGYSADLMKTKVIQILAEWVKYEMAERCGADTNIYITNLKKYLSAIDCTCNENPDDASHVVYAIGTALGSGGSGGSGGSLPTITYGSVVPTGGISGSLYIQTDSQTIPTFCYVWYNSGGTWVIVTNILGSKGSSGADGANSGASSLLYNESGTSTGSGTGAEIINWFNVLSTYLADNDYLDIKALYLLGKTDNGKTLELDFGADKIVDYFTDSLVNDSNKYVRLDGKVIRRSVSTQDLEGMVFRNGVTPCPVVSARTRNLAITNMIKAIGQASVSVDPSSPDITCVWMMVELKSMLTSTPISPSGKEKGILSLPANTNVNVVFATAKNSNDWVPGLTALDTSGSSQQYTLTNKTVNGFTIMTIVDTTLYWEA